MRTRLLLGALGVAVAAYGAWLLLQEDLPTSSTRRSGWPEVWCCTTSSWCP